MPTVSRGLFKWLFQGGASLEDFADRLNHVWTFGLLLVLGVVISWKHGYQSPITCWTPAEFMPAHVNYAHETCWHSYKIKLPIRIRDDNDPLLLRHNDILVPIVSKEKLFNTDSSDLSTTYYQWVPLILCLQALLFKLPNIFMYVLHGFSGLDFNKVAGLTSGYHHLDLTERRDLANQMARYIYRWCQMYPRGIPWRLLTVVWLFVKLLYCINVIIQMAYIDTFLKTTDEPNDNSTSYGDAIYDNIAKNNASFWKVSTMFPRKVLCDFAVRQFKNVHSYSIQCDLNANPFTERAYMFLWVWLLFVSVVTTLSLVVWVLLTVLPFPRQRYIRGFMEITDEVYEDKQIHVTNADATFLAGIIGEDGIMALKLVGANSSELLVKDIISAIHRMARAEVTMPSGQPGQLMQSTSGAQSVIQPSAPQAIYPQL